jgi:hypothetical protein
MKNIVEKIIWGLIAIYLFVWVADIVLPPAPPPTQQAIDEIGRELVIDQLNNTYREQVQKELRQ